MTARGVAAYRQSFDRVPAPFGDPDADQRLQADVAAGLEPPPIGLTRYLQARTAFIDHAVVHAIGAGCAQVVSVGAGYDGRSLRYAAPGVRWFELDHPDTQADKRARLARLDLDSSAIGFAAADFTTDGTGAALAGAGHDPAMPTLFTCEGVVGYLDRATFERLLRSLRARAAPGSRMAVEVPLEPDRPDDHERRAQLRETVGSLGEPLAAALADHEVLDVLGRDGWMVEAAADPRGVALGDGARNTLFVLATPAG